MFYYKKLIFFKLHKIFSIRIVENKWFKKFIEIIQSLSTEIYRLPDRHRLSDDVSDYYNILKNESIDLLKEVRYVSKLLLS